MPAERTGKEHPAIPGINWRTLPSGDETPYGRLAFQAVREREDMKPDEEKYRMWFRASTPGRKTDNLDVPTKSWAKHIKAYMEKNPAFIWAHQYRADGFPSLLNVLGHAIDYRLIDKGDPKTDGLYLLDDFAVDINPYAKMAWQFYQRGDLNAVSVGWEAVTYHTEQDEDSKRDIYVMDETMLLEHSACIVPVDIDALAQRAKGYADEDPVFLKAVRVVADEENDFGQAMKRVLSDEHCAALFCGDGERDKKPSEDAGAPTEKRSGSEGGQAVNLRIALVEGTEERVKAFTAALKTAIEENDLEKIPELVQGLFRVEHKARLVPEMQEGLNRMEPEIRDAFLCLARALGVEAPTERSDDGNGAGTPDDGSDYERVVRSLAEIDQRPIDEVRASLKELIEQYG